MLYKSGFLNSSPSHIKSTSEIFWTCFQQSLNENKRGLDGKQRILSIIAESFPYLEMQEKLEVFIRY